jgi:hypothetical protein
VDTLSTDPGNPTTFPVHEILGRADRWGLEAWPAWTRHLHAEPRSRWARSSASRARVAPAGSWRPGRPRATATRGSAQLGVVEGPTSRRRRGCGADPFSACGLPMVLPGPVSGRRPWAGEASPASQRSSSRDPARGADVRVDRVAPRTPTCTARSPAVGFRRHEGVSALLPHGSSVDHRARGRDRLPNQCPTGRP